MSIRLWELNSGKCYFLFLRNTLTTSTLLEIFFSIGPKAIVISVIHFTMNFINSWPVEKKICHSTALRGLNALYSFVNRFQLNLGNLIFSSQKTRKKKKKN